MWVTLLSSCFPPLLFPHLPLFLALYLFPCSSHPVLTPFSFPAFSSMYFSISLSSLWLMRIPDIHWQIPELFLSYLSPFVDTHFKAKTASLLIYHVCSKARRNSPSADGSTTGVWVLHRFKPILGYALIHSIHHRKGEKKTHFSYWISSVFIFFC